MAIRCNTDRINCAYDTYHGRFGKTECWRDCGHYRNNSLSHN